MRAVKVFAILVLLAILGYGGFKFFSKPAEVSRTSSPSESEKQAEPAPLSPSETNPVVATVGPLEIRLKDLTDLSVPSEVAAENLKESSGVAHSKNRIRQRFLDEMIERRLLVLGSAKHPEWVSDASWEAEVQRRLVEIGADELERRRALTGIPKDEFFSDFRKHVREEMMKNALLEREVEANLSVTDDELKQRYEADRETEYFRPPAWDIIQFARTVPRDPSPNLEELKRQVEEIRAQVAAQIASATDPRGKAQRMREFLRDLPDSTTDKVERAYVYDFPKANFDPALKMSLRTCVVGELSPVFELGESKETMGYCFYFPFFFQPADHAPFERVQRVLIGTIREEKRKELTDQLFERLKREFPVKIHSDLLDLDPPVETPKENAS